MSNSGKLYTPAETAAKLGITVETLKYLRQRGRIQGTFIGNTTLYTDEQIQNADLSKKKPGVKPSKKGTATQDNGDEPSDLSAKASAA